MLKDVETPVLGTSRRSSYALKFLRAEAHAIVQRWRWAGTGDLQADRTAQGGEMRSEAPWGKDKGSFHSSERYVWLSIIFITSSQLNVTVFALANCILMLKLRSYAYKKLHWR